MKYVKSVGTGIAFVMLVSTLCNAAHCFLQIKSQKLPPYCCYCPIGSEFEECHVNNCNFCWGVSCGPGLQAGVAIAKLCQLPVDSLKEHIDGLFLEVIDKISADYNNPLSNKRNELHGSGLMRRETTDFWKFSFDVSAIESAQIWKIAIDDFGSLDLQINQNEDMHSLNYEIKLKNGIQKSGTLDIENDQDISDDFDVYKVIVKKR